VGFPLFQNASTSPAGVQSDCDNGISHNRGNFPDVVVVRNARYPAHLRVVLADGPGSFDSPGGPVDHDERGFDFDLPGEKHDAGVASLSEEDEEDDSWLCSSLLA
jgi:hypothetical protein